MFNQSRQPWALFAIYYFLSCSLGSEAMAQSRKIEYQAPVVSTPVAVRAKAGVRSAAVSRVSAATSKAVVVPSAVFTPPTLASTTSSGIVRSSNLAAAGQFPQINSAAYTPANGVITPTYVQPGIANTFNQPPPDTSMPMLSKVLIFGGIAAGVAALFMKMNGSGSSASRGRNDSFDPKDFDAGDAGGTGDAGDEPRSPGRSAGQRTPPGQTNPEGGNTEVAGGEPAPGPEAVPQSGIAPTPQLPAPLPINTPGAPATQSDATAPPAESAPPAAAASNPQPRAQEAQTPAARVRVCAKDLKQVKSRPRLQENLNSILNNYAIDDGVQFSWKIRNNERKSVPFDILVEDGQLKVKYMGYKVDIERLCSDGTTTRIDVSGERKITVVKNGNQFKASVEGIGKKFETTLGPVSVSGNATQVAGARTAEDGGTPLR